MKATITTFLLAFAAALPIISALPSENRQIDSRDFPITQSCTGLSIIDDHLLYAEFCNGVSDVVIDLNLCITNSGGILSYKSRGLFSGSCNDCTFNGNDGGVMSCFCGQGVGKDFITAQINLDNCRFLWFDQSMEGFDCGDLIRECPN
ncbi:hypothetical protein F4818DRAFT_423764 [Hypoxylon cercidicola]|nr:hypothetical protein F4818DRAFT_423764 [Hypoxylon cercidicola]